MTRRFFRPLPAPYTAVTILWKHGETLAHVVRVQTMHREFAIPPKGHIATIFNGKALIGFEVDRRGVIPPDWRHCP